MNPAQRRLVERLETLDKAKEMKNELANSPRGAPDRLNGKLSKAADKVDTNAFRRQMEDSLSLIAAEATFRGNDDMAKEARNLLKDLS